MVVITKQCDQCGGGGFGGHGSGYDAVCDDCGGTGEVFVRRSDERPNMTLVTPDKCPRCGAAAMGVRVLQYGLDRPRLMDVGDYECETLIVSQEGRHVVVDGETCLRRQVAALREERDSYKRIAEHYESVIGFYADLIKDCRICQERVERREQQVTLEVYDDDDGDDD